MIVYKFYNKVNTETKFKGKTKSWKHMYETEQWSAFISFWDTKLHFSFTNPCDDMDQSQI